MKIISKNTSTIYVNFPIEIKDDFKSMFKNAKWDSFNKVWTVANTSANEERLEQFGAISEEFAQKRAALDNIASTEDELNNLKSAIDLKTKELDKALSNASAQSELSDKLTAMKAKLEAINAQAANAKAEADALTAKNEAALKEILSNHKYEGDSVEYVISRCWYLIKGNHKGKDEFNRLTVWLGKVRDEVLERYGVDFNVLWECSRSNFNRLDRDGKWFTESLYSPRNVTFEAKETA